MRCRENNNVCTHFQNLSELKEQLATMGKVISDEDYTNILLASLPPSYDQSCSFISNSVWLSVMTLAANLFEGMIINKYTRHEIKK